MPFSQLPSELLVLVFDRLVKLHAATDAQDEGQQHSPLLTARASAAVAAAASAHSCWRAACLAEVRCRVRLDSAADAQRLAAAPGLPCTELQLPPPPPSACRSDPAEWRKQQRLVTCLEQLLQSAAFRRRSGATLLCIRNLPVAAAERGALAGGGFPSLHTLSLSPGLCIGSPGSLRGGSLGPCPPPALRHLEVQLAAGGLLSHILWPPGLEHCTILLPDCAAPPGSLVMQPCPCPACQAAASSGSSSFWGGVRSLRVQAARAVLQVDSRLLCLLRRCATLRLEAGCTQSSTEGQGAAVADAAAAQEGGDPELQPWLAAVAPVFAATALQTFELRAACAVLQPPQQAAGGWVLHAGCELAAWEGPQLAAASLPSCGSWRERSAGLAAQLTRGAETAVFQLRVWRCEE